MEVVTWEATWEVIWEEVTFRQDGVLRATAKPLLTNTLVVLLSCLYPLMYIMYAFAMPSLTYLESMMLIIMYVLLYRYTRMSRLSGFSLYDKSRPRY